MFKRLFVSLFFLLLVALPVLSQTPNEPPPAPINLTLSPTFVNLVADPSEEVFSQFRLTNNNSFREYFKIDIAKYEAGETINIVEATAEDEFVSWITFEEPQFSVDPNQTKTVRFTIAPPKSASLGYYYALIISRVQEQKAEEVGQPVVSAAPAFSVLLEVRSPNAKRELQLVDFKTSRFFYEYLPVEFETIFKNTGNVHIVPSGDVFIDWGNQKDIAILPVNFGRANVLPQTNRELNVSWGDGFAVGVPKVENGKVVRDSKGNIVSRTNYDFKKADKFRIGRYTAHLIAVYDNGERDIPVEATVSFWVFPWKLIGMTLLVLFFAFVGLKGTVSSYLKKLK